MQHKHTIIAISGKLGVGKDLTAELIKKHSKVGFKSTAFAKKLKEVVALLTSTPYEGTLTQEGKNLYIPEFNTTIGQMLQDIGTTCLRDNFNKEIWINSCLLETKNNPGNYIITDCRFENEVEALKKIGATIIRINRPYNPIAEKSGRDLNHPSETSLDNYNEFDYVINNDSDLESLESTVISILSELGLLKTT